MSTWAIGDVHGCWVTLQALLARLDIDPDGDSLWLVGDLVNRGPDSLAVLRWARQRQAAMGERFVVTLGNHDLHLIGLAAGATAPRAADRLDEVLRAPDARELIEWLAARPLLHCRGAWLIVHAGLLPSWTLAEAEARARPLESALRDAQRRRELLIWPHPPEGGSAERATARRDLAVFTRMRTLTQKEELCRYTGAPDGAPSGCRPWYDWPHSRGRETTVACGHWAALGLLLRADVVALDTGVAWGGALTALRLEDRRVVSQPRLDT